MPRSKSGKKRVPVDSIALKNALKAVNNPDPEKKMPYREAVKVFNVSLATLSRESKKFKKDGTDNYNYSSNYAVKQIFSEREEAFLAEYIKKVAQMKYGLTKKGVRDLAYRYAVANGKKYPACWDKDQIAGEEWMRGFLKRHNELSIRKPEATSLSRATSFNRTNVNNFFNNIKDVHNRFGPIPPNRIWNLDETGLSTVQSQSKIVAPRGIKQLGSATSAERGSLVTMIAAVNATGNYIAPMLIFPRVFFKDRMTFGAPPGTIGAATPSGWSNEQMFLKFLNHFVNTVKCSREERVLLVLDNHETHLSYEAVEKASNAGIVMVTFPPHTSHKLQPLDLTIYGPLKTFYSQGVEAWLFNNGGKTFDIYSVAEVLGTAFPRAFTPKNILSGFRTSGIFPLDSNIFSEEDFLGSYVTDRDLENQQPVNNLNTTAAGHSETMLISQKNCAEPGPSNTRPESRTPNTSPELMPSNAVIVETASDISPKPGPSNLNHTPTPKKRLPEKMFVSPEEVQPFPKATARKTLKRGRRTGRTMIATDTPEKQEIQKMKANKKKKKAVTKDLNFELTSKKIKTKVMPSSKETRNKGKKRKESSPPESSSESGDVSLVSTDDEDSADEACLFCDSSMAADKTGEKWCRCVTCGRWVHTLCAGINENEWKSYVCDFCCIK